MRQQQRDLAARAALARMAAPVDGPLDASESSDSDSGRSISSTEFFSDDDDDDDDPQPPPVNQLVARELPKSPVQPNVANYLAILSPAARREEPLDSDDDSNPPSPNASPNANDNEAQVPAAAAPLAIPDEVPGNYT